MSILACKAHIGQELREKPERRSLPDKFKHLHFNASYVTIKSSINNEIRFIGNSRLAGKFAGDKTAEKTRERQARTLDYILTQLVDKSNDKKYQLSKVRKEFQTTGNKGLLDEIANLDREIREIDAIVTGKDSDVFGNSINTPLGITNKLRELTESGWLDKLKKDRIKEKKDFSEGNTPKKLSKLGRHSCLEAGTVLEMLYGTNVIFTTVTIPGRTEEAKKAVADFSTVGIDRLLGALRDFSDYYGTDIGYIYVWEFHKDNTLHLHLLWGCNTLEVHRDRIEGIIDRCWFQFLDDLGTTDPAPARSRKGNFPGVDCYQRLESDINNPKRYKYRHITSWKDHKDELKEIGITIKHEKCRKSPAAYMSKYVSKGVNQPNKDKNIYYPSAMWGQSKKLNDIAKEYEIRQDFPKANSDFVETIEYIDQFLDHAIKNDWLASWNSTDWDIYSLVDKDKDKSYRINRKPWEPRPVNSIRVSSGSQICLYIKPEYFSEAREYIGAIAAIAKALKTAPPKDFNKFHANKYYVSEQLSNDIEDCKEITAKRYARSRNYWERIAAGENYQDIELLK
jgi:uncharacterized protein YjgD (DUF1641 family)